MLLCAWGSNLSLHLLWMNVCGGLLLHLLLNPGFVCPWPPRLQIQMKVLSGTKSHKLLGKVVGCLITQCLLNNTEFKAVTNINI